MVLIWGLTGWLLFEAVERVINPTDVDGIFMLGTAIFGLFCNLVMMKTLHGGPGHSHGGGKGGHGGHGGHGGKSGHGGHGDKKKADHGHSHGGKNDHGDHDIIGHGDHGKSGHGGHGDHGGHENHNSKK